MIQALRLYARTNLLAPGLLKRFAVLCILTLFLLVALSFWITEWTIDTAPYLTSSIVGLSILPLAFPLLVIWTLGSHNIRRILKHVPAYQVPFEYTWSKEGLGIHLEDEDRFIPWKTFLKWAENAKVIIVFESARKYRAIPKRVLTDQQCEEIKQYLTEVRKS
ncbi:YcxB family protein [Phyllobacterium myrsinacearum]|nr:YcxB family protein [Phyllobacterium myrsinacearum]